MMSDCQNPKPLTQQPARASLTPRGAHFELLCSGMAELSPQIGITRTSLMSRLRK
jgi:hypothetical protein